jgi:hypothetical protein
MTLSQPTQAEGGSEWRRLGRLAIAFSGQGNIGNHLRGEIHPLPQATGEERDALMFRLGSIVSSANEVQIGRYFVSADQVRVEGPTLDVCFGVGHDAMATLSVRPPHHPALRRLKNTSRQWGDISFLSEPARLAKYFIYEFFNPIVQLRQLSLGQTWLHASALTNGARTIAIMAWGGVGKTSTMLRLMQDDDWRFLADDLAIIDDCGSIYRSPQRIQVYAYNVAGDAPLKRQLLGGRRPLDRLQWEVRLATRGPSRVRRRVHAEDLFSPDRVGEKGVLTDGLVLRRVRGRSFRHRELDYSEAAIICSNVLHAELDPLWRWQAALGGSAADHAFPSFEESTATARLVLSDAFRAANARCVLVDVPVTAQPHDLKLYVQHVLDSA